MKRLTYFFQFKNILNEHHPSYKRKSLYLNVSKKTYRKVICSKKKKVILHKKYHPISSYFNNFIPFNKLQTLVFRLINCSNNSSH